MKDLNLLGYMFDRSSQNHHVTEQLISDLIDKIIKFKSKLSPEELEFWNSSTYLGNVDGQGLAFSIFSRIPGHSIFNNQVLPPEK